MMNVKNNEFILVSLFFTSIFHHMFANRAPVMSPEFILRNDDGREPSFGTSKAEGLWYRVIPENMREVRYIQCLPKNIKLLTPASGHGVLIRADSLPI